MDSDTGTLLNLILFFVFLLLAGFIALCQAAVVELKDVRVKKPDSADPRYARVAKLLCSPSRFAGAMRAASVFSQLCSAVFLARLFGSLSFWPAALRDGIAGRLLGALLVVLVETLFILVIARGAPRRIAVASSEQLGLRLAGPARFFSGLFTPFHCVVETLVLWISALFGVQRTALRENITEEEIRMLVDVSEETGGIDQSEKEMINNVFEFNDRTAADIMTHRTDVKYITEDSPLEEIIRLSTVFGFSRIPVVEDDLDDIIGILHVKDLLPLVLEPVPDRFSVADHLRQALFVPESTRCQDLFAQLSVGKMQVAVVVDEYGGTSGIVTMEDLLESIVGSIQDEYDNEADPATAIDDSHYRLDGDIDLLEVERLLGCDLSAYTEENGYETLSGLLIGVLDRIPGPNEHPIVQIGDVSFTVTRANDRQILSVLAQKLPEEAEEKK